MKIIFYDDIIVQALNTNSEEEDVKNVRGKVRNDWGYIWWVGDGIEEVFRKV
jgi:hypothetical protein